MAPVAKFAVRARMVPISKRALKTLVTPTSWWAWNLKVAFANCINESEKRKLGAHLSSSPVEVPRVASRTELVWSRWISNENAERNRRAPKNWLSSAVQTLSSEQKNDAEGRGGAEEG